MTRRSAPSALAAALAGLLAAGCSEAGPTPPGSALTIEVDGRIERGLVVGLRVLDGGERVPPSAVDWSADPAAAVDFPTDSTARLLESGTVVLVATAGGVEGETALEVAAPPTVVFDLLVDGNRDIYRMALDGRDPIRLTSDPGDDRDPTAAGGLVVFTSYRDGNGELYSIPLEGGTPTRLTATLASETEPTLAPDGGRIAFVSDATGVGKLWHAAADGTGAAPLTGGLGHAGSIEAGPSWAPSADRVVYLSTELGAADLFVVTLAGEQTPLVTHDAADVEPAWSPDGERVAFASNRDGSTDLYVLAIGTGEVTRVTEREESDARPTWTVDGRIVFIARVDGEPRMRWLDPASPGATHDIAAPAGTVGGPAAVR